MLHRRVVLASSQCGQAARVSPNCWVRAASNSPGSPTFGIAASAGNRRDLPRKCVDQGTQRRAPGTGCPPSRTTPASKSMHSAARPASIRRVIAGEAASDEENLDKLLAALEGLPAARRTARYRCVIVYVESAEDPQPLIGEGTWEGRIIDERRGQGGFGYDPSLRSRGRDAHRRRNASIGKTRAESSRAGNACISCAISHAGTRVKTPPLALYAHFPWCVQKCPYCDFNSYTLKETLPEDRYIEVLLRDLDAQAGQVAGRPLVSIFLGGGTPSLFSPAAIARLLEHARARLGFVDGVEITLEANPGTIERGRFSEYRAAGITRVSLGAQSFDARQLALLGRIHSADETRRAAEELHAAGLDNFNLDLMYALPGQSAADAETDLREATRAGASAFVAIPPDDRARHGVRRGAAGAAGGRNRRGNARTFAACAARCEFRTLRSFRICATGQALRPQPQLLDLWRLPRHRRRCARQDFGLSARTPACAPSRRVSLDATSPPTRPRWCASPIAVRDLPFEFAMNGFRLVDGFSDQQFEAAHRPVDCRPGEGPGAGPGPRAGRPGSGPLACNAERFPVSQRHTGRTAAGRRSRAGVTGQAPGLGRFYAQTPHLGRSNKGITAGFSSVAR